MQRPDVTQEQAVLPPGLPVAIDMSARAALSEMRARGGKRAGLGAVLTVLGVLVAATVIFDVDASLPLILGGLVLLGVTSIIGSVHGRIDNRRRATAMVTALREAQAAGTLPSGEGRGHCG
jgi:hypothetical protein